MTRRSDANTQVVTGTDRVDPPASSIARTCRKLSAHARRRIGRLRRRRDHRHNTSGTETELTGPLIRLTSADLADLADGYRINVLAGPDTDREIIICGLDFDEQAIGDMRAGRSTSVDGHMFVWDQAPTK
jgi:hypothetical protein